jgi:Fe-Mn family superoxide dismutase
MFTLPDLPYDYGELEPHISARIMELHHSKHHQTYVDKLNAALANYPELAEKPIEELLGALDILPDDIRTAVRNHGGGHYNHSLFWTFMTPDGGDLPDGPIADKLGTWFGSFDNFKEKFETASAGVFGSGWAWLTDDGEITTTANQDTPLSQGKNVLLGLDVWEHAYYLQYENKRPDYITSWWNVVNWKTVNSRLSGVTE